MIAFDAAHKAVHYPRTGDSASGSSLPLSRLHLPGADSAWIGLGTGGNLRVAVSRSGTTIQCSDRCRSSWLSLVTALGALFQLCFYDDADPQRPVDSGGSSAAVF